MALSEYRPTIWNDGDIITANGMNNIEQGIADNNSAIAELDEKIDGIPTDSVRYVPQSLTTEQKNIAKSNLSLAAIASSGSAEDVAYDPNAEHTEGSVGAALESMEGLRHITAEAESSDVPFANFDNETYTLSLGLPQGDPGAGDIIEDPNNELVLVVTDTTAAPIDDTLSIDGAAADAGAVGVALANLADTTYILNKYANNYSKLQKLKLTGDVSGMSKNNEKVLSFEYFGANESSATHTGYAKVKWQGSSSIAYEKKNYTIKLYSDSACTTTQNIQFVDGWGSYNKYCLKANFIDHTHARNIVMAKIWGECVKHRETTSESYINMHTLPNGGAIDGFPIMLFINDDYTGIYTLNIPKDSWLFGMTGANTECVLSGEKWSNVTQFYDTPTAIGCDDPDWDYEIEPADNSWVLPSLQAIYTALAMPVSTQEQTLAKTAAVEACVDIHSVIDYACMCDILGITDNLGKNQLLVTYDGTKWMLSAYDLDTAFGNYWDGTHFIDAIDDTAGTDWHNNNLTYVVCKQLFEDTYVSRRRYLLNAFFRTDNVMNKVYDIHSFITSELLNGETLLYPSMPNANSNGIAQIESYLTKRLDYKTNTWKSVYDDTLTSSTNYIWIGTIGCQKLRILIDYPDSGIGTAQNVIPYINNIACVWTWCEANVKYTLIESELFEGVITTTGSSANGSNYKNIVSTYFNTLAYLGIGMDSSIPAGSRIRIWALG